MNLIVVYIYGSFIKDRIAVKPIYITVRNLRLAVSCKSFVWRVLGMLPALKKKPTVAQSNALRPAQTQVASCMYETCNGFSK